MADSAWQLQGCCQTQEIIFICFYAGYAVVAVIFGKIGLLKPVRLLSVFAHEFSHASACWMTGGSVKKIEVYDNEGGVTGYTGGCRCIVIPAGYVGAAFWGGAFVALSGNRIGATVVACVITAALLFSLWYVAGVLDVVIATLSHARLQLQTKQDCGHHFAGLFNHQHCRLAH